MPRSAHWLGKVAERMFRFRRRGDRPGTESWATRSLQIVLLAAVVGALWGQPAENPNLPVQPAGPDDLLAIFVYRAPELTRTVRVDERGYIRLPMLDEPIYVAGLLPEAISRRIAEVLKQKGLLVEPIVEVTVAQYASRPVSVMGAVQRPVTFQVVGKVTLLDALAQAGGLSEEAADYLLVSLPAGRGGRQETEVRRIPVKALIDEANPEVNLRLYGGEEIRVPAAGRIYVLGNVRNPGAYPVRSSQEATLLKVLALAGGLERFHAKVAYVYRPDPATGQLQELEVPLAQVLQRKLPDVVLLPNDLLYVPDSKGKRRAVAIVDRAVGWGATTASGILVWRTR